MCYNADMPHRLLPLLALLRPPRAASFDNSCLDGATNLQPPTAGAPQTFLADCPRWVVDTTDAVWSPEQSAAAVNRSLREYFYANWTSVTTYGRKMGGDGHGMRALEEAVWATKRTFPDLKIHVSDVFCVGNDVDGYKTVMPDVLSGTHAPSGRRATWSGIAVCYVQRVGGKWQYVAEWVVHDELAQLRQLGLTDLDALPPMTTVATPHDCSTNQPSWGWQPPTAMAATAMAAMAAQPTASVGAVISTPPTLEGPSKPKPSDEGLLPGYPLPKAKVIVEVCATRSHRRDYDEIHSDHDSDASHAMLAIPLTDCSCQRCRRWTRSSRTTSRCTTSSRGPSC